MLSYWVCYLLLQALCTEPKTRRNWRCSLTTSTCQFLTTTMYRDVTRLVLSSFYLLTLKYIFSQNFYIIHSKITLAFSKKSVILSYNFIVVCLFFSCYDNCWMTRFCVSYRSRLRWRQWRDWASSRPCLCQSRPASAADSSPTGCWSVQ